MNKFVFALRNLFMPPRCAACGAFLEVFSSPADAEVLCTDCRADFERAKLRSCHACGLEMMDCRCSTPEMRKAGFPTLTKLVPYSSEHSDTVTRLIFGMKRKSPAPLCNFLAKQISFPLLKTLGNFDDKDVTVTFIPRPQRSKRRYGVDQSELLARAIAELLGVPMTAVFRRKWHIKEQKKLSYSERKKNVREAFSLRKTDVAGKTFILVDDVVTSGASMCAAAKLLRSSGASEVTPLCIAQTQRKKFKGKKLVNTH